MRKKYLDIIEIVFGAYTHEHIKKYTQSVIDDGLKEHGFPRLTANLGILIANGRKTELKADFIKMMDLCCREIPVAHGKHGYVVGNDFSVKEIIFCLLEVEKSGVVDKAVTEEWRKQLASINPYETYSAIARGAIEPVGNWAAFGAASEVLRRFAGIADENQFIEEQIESQLSAFDENGMYRDPAEPMVYDFVTRLQLAVALYFGYDGQYRKRLEDEFKKSEDMTLYMQSVTGEIPYGGRSNQFLHNETFYAALCEFYADSLKKRGDLKKAGMFKRAARLAVENTEKWLNKEEITHIKNSYDFNSMFGCEGYAYFDKYMVTTASWLYIAYTMCDESIEEVACPAEDENYIAETSSDFHKVFVKHGDYCVEYDSGADYHYDASGIGRIHKKNTPSAICLSVPVTDTPNYCIDIDNPSPLSLSGGIKTREGYQYSFDRETKHSLIEKKTTEDFSFVKFECITKSGISFTESFMVSNDGVLITVEGDGDLEVTIPVFVTDGKKQTEITYSDIGISVEYNGYICRYETSDILKKSNKIYANRNGHYERITVSGKDKISLKINIDKI